MSQPQTICNVCFGTEFYLETGSYFCLECNTQSQDIQEQVFEEWYGGVNINASSRKVQKKSKDLDQRDRLTSWEVLNYVLKGIVDELIGLGAKPELKSVCLQLWASYLRQLDVAFTSVDIERKPKLGYSFKTCDAEIVYGVTKRQLKEKSWRSRRRSGSESDQSSEATSVQAPPTSIRSRKVRLGFSKRALARSEYTKMSQETAKSFSQTLEELDSASASEAAETPKKIKVTKYARSLLSSSGASTTEDEFSARRRIARREVESVRNITTAKVVALVNIALCLTASQIQLSDFLRWVEEGHISLKQARRFLPTDVKVDYRLQQTIESCHLSYVKCQGLVSGMCRQLGIQTLPQADLGLLASRYCLELQLPDEFSQMTRRLLVLMAEARNLLVGNVEAEVMAAVLVVMKLLFSLDDCTEFHLSHAAQQINRASTEAGGGEEVMFVWRDWQHLLECRKAVLAALHLPTRQTVYETSEVGRDTELFLLHTLDISKDLPDCAQPIVKNALNKDFKNSMTQFLQDFVESRERKDSTERIKFPASLTPLHCHTQYLLTHHRARVESVAHILGKDFTKHSIQHVSAPERCKVQGLANDLSILQKKGVVADFQVAELALKETDSTVIPRYGLNQVKTTVKIVKRSERCNQNRSKTDIDQSQMEKRNEFQENLNDLISDDSCDEESDVDNDVKAETLNQHILATSNDSVEIYKTSSQYWFCHFSTGKNSLSLDEFNMLSIKEFSSSFLWFLKECARTINVHPKDLYVQVIQIEKKHKSLLKEALSLMRPKKDQV